MDFFSGSFLEQTSEGFFSFYLNGLDLDNISKVLTLRNLKKTENWKETITIEEERFFLVFFYSFFQVSLW